MINIDINRLTINLHGISAMLAEQAVNGLEQELQRRLGVLAKGELSDFDIGDLSLGPIHSTTQLDAAALRSLLVERLITQIQHSAMKDGSTGEGQV